MFGSLPGSISLRRTHHRREVARTERTRALSMAILNYEAGRPEASDQWFAEAEYQESQLSQETDPEK